MALYPSSRNALVDKGAEKTKAFELTPDASFALRSLNAKRAAAGQTPQSVSHLVVMDWLGNFHELFELLARAVDRGPALKEDASA